MSPTTVTSTVTTAATHTAAHVTCPAVATDALCAVSTGAEVLQKESPTALDSSVLEILGEDPSESIQYGSEIRKELANRLEHIATTGLSKEVRKELLEAYLIPANCTKIGAPLMNAEIKAAVTDVITKRDKGIEMRQKQLACAISGLAGVINTELESSEKNNERLKQLMDIGRILCDVQHSESVTRRNFAIYSIKKDLKDHITNTKIDKYLFGEELAETLKTAKAVSKSGTELKVKSQVRSVKPFTPTSNLNWRARAPARRQQGPQRNREPAHRSSTPGPSSRHTRTPRHGYSSKTSQPPQRQQRRRSLVAACPAIEYGLLYTKEFERCKFLNLKDDDNYDRHMTLPDTLLPDFHWWLKAVKHSITKDIWQWCESRNIHIFASYIKSAENVVADAESRRTHPDIEWELADGAFKEITRKFGHPQAPCLHRNLLQIGVLDEGFRPQVTWNQMKPEKPREVKVPVLRVILVENLAACDLKAGVVLQDVTATEDQRVGGTAAGLHLVGTTPYPTLSNVSQAKLSSRRNSTLSIGLRDGPSDQPSIVTTLDDMKGHVALLFPKRI
ncbi:uncharacterized protein LOC134805796 [Cydia splendana]|uniref:uncharacterized protein LOC134805796 n=1 Tax=Cydia splendana TaxID=1100963 RepID=UPI00300C1CF1